MRKREQLMALFMATASLTSTQNISAAAQCPNLSGEYVLQGEDGRVYYTIDQHECERITIVIRNNYLGDISSERHTLQLDGKEQKDTAWYGSSEQYRTSAQFIGSKLQIKARSIDGRTLTTNYALTKARDLSIEDHTGLPDVPSIAKRQK